MPSYKNTTEEYDLVFHAELPLSWKVSRAETDPLVPSPLAAPFFLPKSQVEPDERNVYRRGAVCRFTIPDWLAEKHDLV